MFRYLQNFYLQPFPALLLLLAEECIDVLSFFYCQFRFRAKSEEIIVAVHQIISMSVRSLLLLKYKGITNNGRVSKLVRCVGGALYGACHYIVLINIFDRNFRGEGVYQAFANTVYLGFETLMPLVYIFGFKLRKGIFALHDLEWCPKKYMIITMMLTGLTGAIVSLVLVIKFSWEQFGLLICLTMAAVRGLAVLIMLVIFIAKYRSTKQKQLKQDHSKLTPPQDEKKVD